MYFGFYFDFIKTFCNNMSDSYKILNEFFNYPLENAILPNNNDAFEIYVF